MINSVSVIYFSATGTTKKIIREICSGFENCDFHYLDITNPKKRSEPIGKISEDLLLLALPVYEERIPPFIFDCIQSIKGHGQPAVVIGVYGNVGFGIVLIEMQKLLNHQGFVTVGGGSFIGEHSFSHSKLPVAVGRPDRDDLIIARRFGKEIQRYLNTFPENNFNHEKSLDGKLPLMARILPSNSSRLFADYPHYESGLCNQCGICVNKCPVSAIDPKNFLSNDHLCTRCFACVRYCPNDARSINLKNKLIVKMFFKKIQNVRKVPSWEFL